MDSLVIIGQFIVAAILLMLFLEIFFEPRFKKRIVGYAFVTGVLYLVYQLSKSQFIAASELPYIVQIRQFISIVIFVLAAIALFGGSPLMKFFLTAFFYILTFGTEYIFIVLGEFLVKKQVIPDNTRTLLIAWALSKLLLFMIIVVTRQIWRLNRKSLDLSLNEWGLFLYFPFLTIIAFLFLLGLPSIVDIGILGTAVIMGLILMNLLVFYLLHSTSDRHHIIHEAQLIKQQYNNEIKNLSSIKSVYEAINIGKYPH